MPFVQLGLSWHSEEFSALWTTATGCSRKISFVRTAKLFNSEFKIIQPFEQHRFSSRIDLNIMGHQRHISSLPSFYQVVNVVLSMNPVPNLEPTDESYMYCYEKSCINKEQFCPQMKFETLASHCLACDQNSGFHQICIHSILFPGQVVRIPLATCHFIELLSPAKAIFGLFFMLFFVLSQFLNSVARTGTNKLCLWV